MPLLSTIKKMKAAIENSPRNDFTSEVWIQMIKYHAELDHVTSGQIAKLLDLKKGYVPEISKSRKVAQRLVAAGLDLTKLT